MALTKPHLLMLALLLAMLQFFVLPTYQQQQQSLASLQRQQSQQARITAALANASSLQQTLATQHTYYQAWLNQHAYLATELNSGQLRVILQQQLNELVTQSAIELRLFEWLTEQNIAEQQGLLLQARMVLYAKPEELMAFHLQTLQQPGLAVVNFDLQRQPTRATQSYATLTLTLSWLVLDSTSLIEVESLYAQ